MKHKPQWLFIPTLRRFGLAVGLGLCLTLGYLNGSLALASDKNSRAVEVTAQSADGHLSEDADLDEDSEQDDNADDDAPETPDQIAKRRQLESLQEKIRTQEKNIENKQIKEKFLSNLLKQSEQQIADVARQLNQVQSEKKAAQKKSDTLKIEQRKLNTEEQAHKKLLASQLASMYMTGSHDYSKMLLNQQEPSKIERVLGYYQFLNQARTDNIDRIEGILTRLTEIDRQLSETVTNLAQLEQKRAEQQVKLNQHQNKRKKTLAQLRKRLKTEAQQLEQLRVNEQALTTALAKIEALGTQAIELLGLSAFKGKLGWPVAGSLDNQFGRKRKGNMRWKGVTIDSDSGTPVKTVHQGQVLFADWLKGFGWVIVINHGDGYMSLYGHNQTLLKNVGEKVEAGEPIALVGKSGGQAKAGLYFELRHQGVAINPVVWCKKDV